MLNRFCTLKTPQYHATQLKLNMNHIHRIPKNKHENVFRLMPKHFFNIDTLSYFVHVTIHTNNYLNYFGHIPLYYHGPYTVTWLPNHHRVYLVNQLYIVVVPHLCCLYVSAYIK